MPFGSVVLRASRRPSSWAVCLWLFLLLMLIVGSPLGLARTSAAASTPSLQAWSTQFLSKLGAPAKSPTAPRVQFLEHWANVEGTFAHGNPNNPLDTKMRARGAKLYNAAGVKAYPTLLAGFQATLSTLRQSIDHPILAALSNPKATIPMLGLALAESNWTGFGARSWNEQMYASDVSGLPLSSFKLPQPTVSIRGVVVNPVKRRVGDVCVTPITGTTPLPSVLTAANGTYRITNLPRAPYRLEVSDCRHILNNAPATYYDARAPQHVNQFRAKANVLSSACSMDKPCLTQSINVEDVITFGILRPNLTWPTPAAITYGTLLSARQLDAKASVPGTLHYSLDPGTRLDPGTHLLSLTFEPRDPAAFTPIHATHRVVVNRLQAVLSWRRPAPVVSGTPLSATQLDAVASVPGTFVYSPPAGTVFAAGPHAVAVRFQPANRTLFRAVTRQISVLVVPATPNT